MLHYQAAILKGKAGLNIEDNQLKILQCTCASEFRSGNETTLDQPKTDRSWWKWEVQYVLWIPFCNSDSKDNMETCKSGFRLNVFRQPVTKKNNSTFSSLRENWDVMKAFSWAQLTEDVFCGGSFISTFVNYNFLHICSLFWNSSISVTQKNKNRAYFLLPQVRTERCKTLCHKRISFQTCVDFKLYSFYC